jgi:hypothetical protein
VYTAGTTNWEVEELPRILDGEKRQLNLAEAVLSFWMKSEGNGKQIPWPGKNEAHQR